MPSVDDHVRRILDFWVTWFLSKKAVVVSVSPALAAELRRMINISFPDDPGLEGINAWLDKFTSGSESEIPPRHDFNLAMLQLIKRNAGSMTEHGKMILLNVMKFLDESV